MKFEKFVGVYVSDKKNGRYRVRSGGPSAARCRERRPIYVI